jgi:hypothetical protein
MSFWANNISRKAIKRRRSVTNHWIKEAVNSLSSRKLVENIQENTRSTDGYRLLQSDDIKMTTPEEAHESAIAALFMIKL